VALLLWLGFYGVGIGLAVALLSLPWAQIQFEGSVGISGLLCGLGALSVLWALFPRFEKFVPPSDPLDRAAFPRVSGLISDIANRVGHPEPEELYLTPQANAFAGRRKPNWHSRGRSIVGVGLVLFEIFERDELASVVAHEMGHHRSGDVLMGPWIYRIRRAIGGALDRLGGSSFWLHLPFVGYGALFMRITRRTSREQELAADTLAARVCGSAATATALVRVHHLAPLWDAYWEGEVVPVLNRGFRPPLLEGFRSLLRLPKVREQLATLARKHEDRPPSPTDTHPPLAERLAALGESTGVHAEAAPPEAARHWFDDPDAAELAVVRSVMTNPDRVLPVVSWAEVGEKVWIPHWKKMLAELGDAFDGVTLERLPALALDPIPLGAQMGALAIFSPEAERRRLHRLLGAWLAVTLHGAGFTATAEPGAEVRLDRDGLSIEPDAIVSELAAGGIAAAEWQARCAAIRARPALPETSAQ
jgi:Zn-dependent protease with chaperone function